jgi:hypothetical protein
MNSYQKNYVEYEELKLDFSSYIFLALIIGIISFIIYRFSSKSSTSTTSPNINTAIDPLNCGSIGNNCNANGTNYVCQASQCVCATEDCTCSNGTTYQPCSHLGGNQTCSPTGCVCGLGLAYCPTAEGTCHDLDTEITNCGQCGYVCPGGQSCIGGSCSGGSAD